MSSSAPQCLHETRQLSNMKVGFSTHCDVVAKGSDPAQVGHSVGFESVHVLSEPTAGGEGGAPVAAVGAAVGAVVGAAEPLPALPEPCV